MRDVFQLKLSALLRKRGKDAFILSRAHSSTLLDVGCGNGSPARVASVRPDLFYIGLDVGDYNITASAKADADEYILSTPEKFADSIRQMSRRVDAIVSAHNLEHCDDPYDVVAAMAEKLDSNGSLYIAFPCAESVRFPARQGTLNFLDDPSHRAVIDVERVFAILRDHAIEPIFAARRYRPKLLAALGLVFEPLAHLSGRNIPFGATWALYGFETVIWGQKRLSNRAG